MHLMVQTGTDAYLKCGVVVGVVQYCVKHFLQVFR